MLYQIEPYTPTSSLSKRSTAISDRFSRVVIWLAWSIWLPGEPRVLSVYSWDRWDFDPFWIRAHFWWVHTCVSGFLRRASRTLFEPGSSFHTWGLIQPASHSNWSSVSCWSRWCCLFSSHRCWLILNPSPSRCTPHLPIARKDLQWLIPSFKHPALSIDLCFPALIGFQTTIDQTLAYFSSVFILIKNNIN